MEHDDTERFSGNFHYFVWVVSEIGLHAKCLVFGWWERTNVAIFHAQVYYYNMEKKN